jgi:hypothetical protein
MTRALVAALGLAIGAGDARADVQAWTEVGVSHEVEDWRFTFDQHLRFDEDVSRVGSVMPELGVTYRIAKWFRTGVGYRLEYERDGSGDMVTRHRFHVRGSSRYDIGKWVRLEHRLQLQESLRPSSNDMYRHVMRNRADVSLRRYKPFVASASAELFHAIDRGDAIHLDKIWLTASGTYGAGPNDFELFYRVEVPQADPMDPTLHIFGLAYHRDL